MEAVNIPVLEEATERVNISALAIPESMFRLRADVVIEEFDDGVLVLNLHSKKMIELDNVDGWVLRHVDGQSTFAQVVRDFAETFKLNDTESVNAVTTTYKKLAAARVLCLVRGNGKGWLMDDLHYIQNPDVNLREEDADGALLFNPDADRFQLLNKTGLHIWKFCIEPRTVDEITTVLQSDYDEVPETVAVDVEEFINQMIEGGFIGMVEAR
jgi:hypothetical protein